MTTTAFNDANPKLSNSNTPKLKGGLHEGDKANRFGGGSAGPETRYHNEASDTARFHEAKEGATVRSPHHGETPVRVPEAKINTMDGPGRGAVGGASHPTSKGQDGFAK